MCDFKFMPEVVAAVASHRGYGFFVVPRLPATKPALAVLRTTTEGGVWRRSGYGWYDYLLSFAVMLFDLPADAFTCLGGAKVRHPEHVQVVLARFGTNGRFKAVPRPECRFRLACIADLDSDGPKLGVRPTLLHRVSPEAWDAGPTILDDTCPATPSPCLPGASVDVAPLPSRWGLAQPAFEELRRTYPHKGVADLAIEALTDGLNPYKGSLHTKAVAHPVLYERDEGRSV